MRLLNFRNNGKTQYDEIIERTMYSKLQGVRGDCFKQMCVQWTLKTPQGPSVYNPVTRKDEVSSVMLNQSLKKS